jgi:hypothetical protein
VKIKTSGWTSFLLLGSAVKSSAALLVYEGFSGYSNDSALTNLTPNANTVGLARSGEGSTYGNDSGSNQPGGMRINNSAGLTMGSLQTIGGAVRYGTSTYVAHSVLTTTTTGTVVWGSFLVNPDIVLGGDGNGSRGMEVRLNSSSVSNSSDVFFRASPDSRASTDLITVSYDAGLSNAGSTVAMTPGTTYLILSRFDFGASGGATLWAMNLSQFNAFIAADRSDSFLNNAANFTARVTDAQAGTYGWDGNYLEFVSSGVSGYLDEIRFGESIIDVTPIPEPTTVAIAGIAGFLFTFRRRS